MRLLATLCLCLLTSAAYAQKHAPTTHSASSAAPAVQTHTPSSSTNYSYHSTTPVEFSNRQGSIRLSGVLGWFGTEQARLWKDSKTNGNNFALSGLIGVGGDFEYFADTDLSVGALIRYYGTGDDYNADVKVSMSSFAFAPAIRFHLPHKRTDFYVGSGMGFTSSSSKLESGGTSTTTDTGATFTAFLQAGVLYAITDQIAAGFETTRYLPLSPEFNGWLLQDFLLKTSFTF